MTQPHGFTVGIRPHGVLGEAQDADIHKGTGREQRKTAAQGPGRKLARAPESTVSPGDGPEVTLGQQGSEREP